MINLSIIYYYNLWDYISLILNPYRDTGFIAYTKLCIAFGYDFVYGYTIH